MYRIPDADCVLKWPPAGSITQDSLWKIAFNDTFHYPTGVSEDGCQYSHEDGIFLHKNDGPCSPSKENGAPGFDEALRDYIERHNDTERSHPVAEFPCAGRGLTAASFAAFHIVPREYLGTIDLCDSSQDSWPKFVKLLFKDCSTSADEMQCEPVVDICDFDLLPAGDVPAIPLRMCFWEGDADCNTGNFAYVCHRKTGRQAFKVGSLIF